MAPGLQRGSACGDPSGCATASVDLELAKEPADLGTLAPVTKKVDGRTERWREHRAARRDELLDATLRVIAERGPDVSMEEIARDAGVSKPRLYEYFGDKRELFEAVADRFLARLWDRLAPGLEFDTPSRTVLESLIRACVDLLDEAPNVARFLLGRQAFDRPEAERFVENSRRFAAAITALFEEALRSLNASTAGAQTWAHATMGAVSAAVEQWLDTRSTSKQELIEHLTTYIWGAVEASLKSEGVTLDPAQLS